MTSKGYMYALVRYNSLLRAREWGAVFSDSLLSSAIPDDSQLDQALDFWNSTGFIPFNDARCKDLPENERGEVSQRDIDSIRLIYVRARTGVSKDKSIGIKDLEQFVEGFRTTVLILDGKLSHDATIMTYQRFPYVYKFSDFIMTNSVYDSHSRPVSDAILYSLSQSSNSNPYTEKIPLQHRELPLYVPRDNVPFLRFMKSEKMIFETLRQSTIPGSYDMINYRYVDENYRMTFEELNQRNEEKESRKRMKEIEKETMGKRVGRKRGEKSSTSTFFLPTPLSSSSSSSSSFQGFDLKADERQEALQRLINDEQLFSSSFS